MPRYQVTIDTLPRQWNQWNQQIISSKVITIPSGDLTSFYEGYGWTALDLPSDCLAATIASDTSLYVVELPIGQHPEPTVDPPSTTSTLLSGTYMEVDIRPGYRIWTRIRAIGYHVAKVFWRYRGDYRQYPDDLSAVMEWACLLSRGDNLSVSIYSEQGSWLVMRAKQSQNDLSDNRSISFETIDHNGNRLTEYDAPSLYHGILIGLAHDRPEPRITMGDRSSNLFIDVRLEGSTYL